MLDIENAKNAFQNYISRFDSSNDKIKLKLEHTYYVMKISQYLCQEEHVSKEDQQLAMIIALLHDIGRFEQIRQFDSFDDGLIDHAKLGVTVLFDEGLIENFVSDRQYDHIIKHAILYHSLYQIPLIADPQLLLHVQLIRDSDKLDNFRVKNVASLQTLFGISETEFLAQRVSDNIMQNIMDHQLILKTDRKNEADMWVSYFAFVFDLNLEASYHYLLTSQYIEKNMHRFPWQGQLKRQMETVKRECINYIKSHDHLG